MLRKRAEKIEPSFKAQKKLYEESTIKQQKQINELIEKIKILEHHTYPTKDEYVRKQIYKTLKDIKEGKKVSN